MTTKSAEGLDIELKLSVIYRPIVSELYALDTEIGPNYYDEVVGPEFRSACRGVFARHSYTELQKKNEAHRERGRGRGAAPHGGQARRDLRVTLESITVPPELAERLREQVAIRLDTERERLAFEKQLAHKKQLAEQEAELRKLDPPPACAPAPAAPR